MRIRYRNFSGGLYLTSARDGQPDGTLRRASGVGPLLRPSVRSRNGCSLVATLPTGTPRTIFTLGSTRYVVTDTNVQKVTGTAASQAFSIVNTGVRPVMAFMIPTIDTDETKFPQGPVHAFGAGLYRGGPGGVVLQKISTSGQVSKWGLDPPNDGFTAGKQPEVRRVLAHFDDLNDTLVSPLSAGTIVTNPRQEGSGALQVHVAAKKAATAAITFPGVINVTQFQGIPSGDEDWITLWVQVDEPANLASLHINFGCAQDTFLQGFGKSFTYDVLVDDQVLKSETVVPAGISDLPDFSSERSQDRQAAADTQQRYLNPLNPGNLGPNVSTASGKEALNALSVTKIPAVGGAWIQLRIPRNAFTASDRSLVDPTVFGGWSTLFGVKLTIHTNESGPVTVTFDELGAVRGTGMIGDYQYLTTYRNSKTGTRSNPNKTAVTVKGVRRNDVALSLQAVFNPTIDADEIEIWRTVGEGAVFFYNDKVPNTFAGTASPYYDRTADFFGLSTALHTKYLQAIELPVDNSVPPSTVLDVCGPYLDRLFLTCDTEFGSRGRVYFSPPGRAESVEGFVVVSHDDETTQKCVLYNSTLFAFTNRRVYEITGTDPFIAVEVMSVPGTSLRHTIVSTPFGVVYVVPGDGVRLFNGASSSLVFPEAVLPLFRRETVSDSAYSGSFSAVHAAYHNDEYFVSNDTTTLALNLRTGAWRDVGKSTSVLFPDGADLVCGDPNRLFVLEDAGVTTDFGGTIPFEMETPGTLIENQSGVTKLIQRLYLDLDTSGATVQVNIHKASGFPFTTTASTSGRQLVEVSLGLACEVVSVRISGNLVLPVEVFGVELDAWIPEAAGFTGPGNAA